MFQIRTKCPHIYRCFKNCSLGNGLRQNGPAGPLEVKPKLVCCRSRLGVEFSNDLAQGGDLGCKHGCRIDDGGGADDETQVARVQLLESGVKNFFL